MPQINDNLTVIAIENGVVILAGDDGSVYKLVDPNYSEN